MVLSRKWFRELDFYGNSVCLLFKHHLHLIIIRSEYFPHHWSISSFLGSVRLIHAYVVKGSVRRAATQKQCLLKHLHLWVHWPLGYGGSCCGFCFGSLDWEIRICLATDVTLVGHKTHELPKLLPGWLSNYWSMG